MKNFVALLALSAAALTATTAHASTMDSFTLTTSSDTYTFSLPASPTPSATNGACPDSFSGDFCMNSVSVVKNGNPASTTLDSVEFFTANASGGIELLHNGYSFLDDTGSQLFTSSVMTPTFKLGTFTLTPFNSNNNYYGGDGYGGYNNCNGNGDSLTISQVPDASPVPEPSSIAFLSTGLLAAAGTIRRRFSR